MNILITGATGFIGSEISKQLIDAGHQITCCVRNVAYAKNLFPHANIIATDFINDTDPTTWHARLNKIEIVINAVGIFYHPNKDLIWKIHYDTPKALFTAAKKLSIKKIIHISALGIEHAKVPYAESKYALENFLRDLGLRFYILRPSVVYGNQAPGSMTMFRALSTLPVMMLPGNGQQKLQPIHVSDLARAVVEIVKQKQTESYVLSAVGPDIVTLKEIISANRRWLGLTNTISVKIPLKLIYIFSFFGNMIPNSLLNLTAFKLLSRDNIASKKETLHFENIIGFTPRGFFVGLFDRPSNVQDYWFAKLFFIKPMLKYTIAFIWIWSGICSIFFFKAKSYQLLSTINVPIDFQSGVLYSASLINLLFGLSILLNYKLKISYLLQLFVILFYTAIITIGLPMLWLEPFEPIAKNIPILVAIWLLYSLE